MALADWTLASDQTPTWTLNSTYSIKGAFSGAVYGLLPADPALGSWVTGYSLSPINKPCGRIRMMYAFNPFVRGLDNIGVFAQMQSSIGTGNTAYFALVKVLGGTLSLHKDTIVSANVTPGLVQIPYAISATPGTVYAIQLNWQTDPVSGAMLLIVSTDGPIANPSTYDYSTLTSQITYTDSVSPLTTCYTVGMAGRIEPVGVPGNYQLMDEVYVYTD